MAAFDVFEMFTSSFTSIVYGGREVPRKYFFNKKSF